MSIIATLPSLEEARAKICGNLATPASKISILLAPGSKIANLARAKSLKIIHRIKMADLNKIIDELSTLTIVEKLQRHFEKT